jgi:hypothetical protein
MFSLCKILTLKTGRGIRLAELDHTGNRDRSLGQVCRRQRG